MIAITTPETPRMHDLRNVVSRVQTAEWIGEGCEAFAVGRCDGVLGVYRLTRGRPTLVQAESVRSGLSVDAVCRLDGRRFVSTNDEQSLLMWHWHEGRYVAHPVPYPAEVLGRAHGPTGAMKTWRGQPPTGPGPCTSAATLDRLLITGHEFGSLLFWEIGDEELTFLREAPTSATIRSIVRCGDGRFLTGDEDGRLSVWSPRGLLHSIDTNRPGEPSGINCVAVAGDFVLVGSCPRNQPRAAENFACYRLGADNEFTLTARQHLLSRDTVRAYTFFVLAQRNEEGADFLASTEEGLIWNGSVSPHGRIHVHLPATDLSLRPEQHADRPGGAALLLGRDGLLIAAAYDVLFLECSARPAAVEARIEEVHASNTSR